jgi:hypothetical protein
MRGLTRSTALEGLGFLLCSAALTAPGAAVFAFSRGARCPGQLGRLRGNIGPMPGGRQRDDGEERATPGRSL